MGNDRLEGRNGAIWQAYCTGATQEALAEEHGLSQAQVSRIIAQVRASIPPTDLDNERQEHVEFLREMRRQAAEIAAAPARPKFSQGVMMRDENGQPILDNAEKLAAMKTAVAIGERASKLLGLDAPQQVEHGITEAALAAAAEAAANAASRLHGE